MTEDSRCWQWEIDKGSYETVDYIIEHIAEGESLRKICKDKGWRKSFVARWIAENPEINAQYEAALGLWADSLAQETIEISDDTQTATDGTQVSSATLRVNTRLKLASRWNRQRYGETPSLQINAQAGSLISILQSLPPVLAPEEHIEQDVTPQLQDKPEANAQSLVTANNEKRAKEG
jgi:hypothetical protein